jgi:gamma-glutamyltranspeptidase
MHCEEGTRLASGAPGGLRIPAIVLQIILEMTKGGGNLLKAINKKRVSVSPIGELELEDMNLAKIHHAHRIFEEEYFGPSSAILRRGNGDIYVGTDDRFKSGVAVI